ncbi:mechanosensitive ion channel MscS [Salinarchaeum sp. Harcht-Bsk1]|uniref:mechanosensitive ion channel family protein n=1 Tax=Salinarchaeum sp. Harcht-Bsk1 TaxID=1333523 RepID=UPI00034231E3|nr:mechanosensitive ion channel family protein [Salinarchaeum sp. Harcht-Bsk1]AGN02581.1 mechanosensitive ion channel MscS [Salinarchaeum sp. Harcht-Bsk1]
MIPLQGLGPVERFLEDNTDLALGTIDTLSSLLIFVGVLVGLYVIGRATVLPIARRLFARRGLDEHASKPLLKVVWFVVLFAAIAIAFGAAGYGNFLSSLAVIAAAATLAVGFAMQDVIKNFVSGIFIFSEKPFRIGDWIEWGDHSGVVEDISLRVTRVRTFDNELLTVANSELTNGVLKNPVAKDKLRLQFTFGIGYGDDVDAATEIVVEEAEAHDGIMDDPAPSVRLTELGDSYVGLTSRIWIENPSRADFVGIRGEYVQSVKERFDEEGIDIPYPTRTLDGVVEVGEQTA